MRKIQFTLQFTFFVPRTYYVTKIFCKFDGEEGEGLGSRLELHGCFALRSSGKCAGYAIIIIMCNTNSYMGVEWWC